MKDKAKLLIVDDEQEILEFLVTVFRDCNSETALNAASALKALRKERFDVLITDIRMPGGSGLDLIDSAKILCPDLAIIVITGHYQELPAETDKKVHQWILKPFSVEDIREAVTSAIEKMP
jgi:DNA-binding NtrC family response regulator